MYPTGYILLREKKKRIGRCAPVSLQIFIVTSLKDSRREWVRRNREESKNRADDSEVPFEISSQHCKVNSMKRGQKNRNEHGFMSCWTVKSSLHVWSKDSFSVNPWVSVPLFSNHPSLYLSLSLLQWWGQRKALTAHSLPGPPSLLFLDSSWVSLGEARRLD